MPAKTPFIVSTYSESLISCPRIHSMEFMDSTMKIVTSITLGKAVSQTSFDNSTRRPGSPEKIALTTMSSSGAFRAAGKVDRICLRMPCEVSHHRDQTPREKATSDRATHFISATLVAKHGDMPVVMRQDEKLSRTGHDEGKDVGVHMFTRKTWICHTAETSGAKMTPPNRNSCQLARAIILTGTFRSRFMASYGNVMSWIPQYYSAVRTLSDP